LRNGQLRDALNVFASGGEYHKQFFSYALEDMKKGCYDGPGSAKVRSFSTDTRVN